jgi:hypothetical protein
MDRKKFEAILILLIPQVVELISANERMEPKAATELFYTSEVYSLLEQEETKLWHLSPLTLYTMFKEEQEKGTISFPEEA